MQEFNFVKTQQSPVFLNNPKWPMGFLFEKKLRLRPNENDRRAGVFKFFRFEERFFVTD